MNTEVNPSKVLKFLAAAAVAAVCAWKGAPLMDGREFPVNMLVTVFSIVTALYTLVASLLVDPSMVPMGSWRLAQLYHRDATVEAAQGRGLFLLFLLTIVALILASFSPLREPGNADLPAWLWVDRVTLFLSALALQVSLVLPGMLFRIQLRRLEKLVADRREEERLQAEKDRREMDKAF